MLLIPIVPRADSGWSLVIPVIAGSGLGLLVSQLSNCTLAPISERASEAAGVNSAARSFGLSFGLAFAGAIMLATLSITFIDLANASSVLEPAEKQRVANALEDDAQVLSNTQLDELLVGQPDVQAEIIRINTEARSLFRWRCSSRSSPPSPGCSTRSGCCAYQMSSRRLPAEGMALG